jgi:hypothetical protein
MEILNRIVTQGIGFRWFVRKFPKDQKDVLLAHYEDEEYMVMDYEEVIEWRLLTERLLREAEERVADLRGRLRALREYEEALEAEDVPPHRTEGYYAAQDRMAELIERGY